MNHQQLPQPQSLIHANYYVWPSRQVMNGIHTMFCWLHVFEHGKIVISLHLVQTKDNKMSEISSIDRNVLNFFCMPLNTKLKFPRATPNFDSIYLITETISSLESKLEVIQAFSLEITHI